MGQVQISRDGAIATVTFDRGTSANPLSTELMTELTATAHELAEDTSLVAVILAGRADNFSLGYDLNPDQITALLSAPLTERRHFVAQGKRMCKAWEDLPQLTIAAIEGWCVGGGVALAVAADLRVISEDTTLYVPEIERGLNMSWGSVPRITNLVGPARAKRIILLAERIRAATATDWGLADHAVSAGTTLEAAAKLANKAAGMPPLALRIGKSDINAYANALAGVATHADQDQFALALGSDDAREGIAAFFDKRPPRFSGN